MLVVQREDIIAEAKRACQQCCSALPDNAADISAEAEEGALRSPGGGPDAHGLICAARSQQRAIGTPCRDEHGGLMFGVGRDGLLIGDRPDTHRVVASGRDELCAIGRPVNARHRIGMALQHDGFSRGRRGMRTRGGGGGRRCRFRLVQVEEGSNAADNNDGYPADQ